MAAYARIVLIGLSGTGKSTVSAALAERLGWAVVDTDQRIEQKAGQSIPTIFASAGELAFREIERRILVEALRRKRVVIATGAGAVIDPIVWDRSLLESQDTLVVALDARPETSISRLRDQQKREGNSVARPLLEGNDPLGRIAALKERRQVAYDRADITLSSDQASPAQLAAEIAGLVEAGSELNPSLCLQAPGGQSQIFVRDGSSESLGMLVRSRWPKTIRCWVITDANVGRIHLKSMEMALSGHGYQVGCHSVPSGEGSKSLAIAGTLLDWLLDGGIERSDVIVALGGGVIGDLAGFVAATCLRGVGLVQVPTTLLAMVDSSVGGKTGVNHRTGKNLIGAFYHPHLVVIDPRLLRTLPRRELVQGWAEVLKHGVIQPSTPGGERADLLTLYERSADRLTDLAEVATAYTIRRNVALKAAVVEADERESGMRAYLNFGHTLGHAIEAAGYRYLHGEAVAAGMRAAARIGVDVGLADERVVNRLDGLIARYGLPAEVAIDQNRALALVARDKKRVAGKTRWVLPLAAGGVTIRDDVPEEIVRDCLARVLAPEKAHDLLPG